MLSANPRATQSSLTHTKTVGHDLCYFVFNYKMSLRHKIRIQNENYKYDIFLDHDSRLNKILKVLQQNFKQSVRAWSNFCVS